MATLPRNEGKCLDAVLRVIEGQAKAIRQDLIVPEATSSSAHPVELVCQIGARRFAFEHTRVEAFDDQIGDGVNFARMTDGLREIEPQLPANGLYQLILPIGATRGIKHHEVNEIRRCLYEWVLDAAKRLSLRDDRGSMHGTPTGVPFPVQLIWQRWIAAPKIFAVRGVSDATIERERASRMLEGIGRKISKLRGWAESGANDVLILECWDGALWNFPLLRDTFAAAVLQLDHIPSYVFSVDTAIPVQWTVWAIRLDGIDQSDRVIPAFCDFDPGSLKEPREHG